MAVMPIHSLAYMLHSNQKEGLELAQQKQKEAFDFAKQRCSIN